MTAQGYQAVEDHVVRIGLGVRAVDRALDRAIDRPLDRMAGITESELGHRAS